MSIPAPGCKVRYTQGTTAWSLWDRDSDTLAGGSVEVVAGATGVLLEIWQRDGSAGIIRFPVGDILMNSGAWEVIEGPLPPMILKPRRKLHLTD